MPRSAGAAREFLVTAELAAWITATISYLGYGGLILLMGIESACTPLPSEVIMPFAGYLASTGRFSLFAAALAGAVGCNLGSAVAYAVGATGGRPFVARYGRYVLLDLGDLARAERFFARFGSPAVFFARLLPVVRAFIALPAGMAHMRLVPFHAYTFVGSFLWCFALAYVGDRLGARWSSDPQLQAVLHRFDALILAVVVLGGAWFVWTRVRRSD
jgi:membrane protein DedA with SNARE-associated domain